MVKFYSHDLINNWLNHQRSNIDQYYEERPEKKPKNYNSQFEAIEAIKSELENYRRNLVIESNSKSLKIKDIVNIIINNVAITRVIDPSSDNTSNAAIAFYNYDTKIYEYSTSVLNEYIVAILGEVNQNILKSTLMTLEGRHRELCLYNPLPNYKIAVGNGIYNCLTNKLEPFDPKYTVLTKIKTNYNPNAKQPDFSDNFTFEQMINQLANHDENRKLLIHQILKSIVTGNTKIDAFFIFVGPGGSGKSSFFEAIINMIGRSNVGFVNFSEINNADKMLETMNKKLVIGMDNDVNLYIKSTRIIKSIASHETMTLSRKYLPAISIPFSAVFVQLCNEHPRFAETGPSMERRYITCEAQNSHYIANTINVNVKDHIKNEQFLQYMLKYILDLPYYADFNDVDRKSTENALTEDDALYQFFEDLYQNNILISINKKIPTHILYNMYKEWSFVNNKHAKLLSSKSFTNRIEFYIKKYSFNISDVSDRLVLKSLINNGQFIPDLLNEYLNYDSIKDLLDNENSKNRYIYFDESIDLNEFAQKRRNDYIISSIQYFGLNDKLDKFAEINNLLNEISIDSTIETNSNSQQIKSISKLNLLECDTYEKMQEYINSDYDFDLTLKLINHLAYIKKDPTLVMKVKAVESDSDKLNQLLNYLADELKQKESN